MKIAKGLRQAMSIGIWILLVWQVGLIISNSLSYFRFDPDEAFLIEKAEISGQLAWRFCLYLHVAAAMTCLTASLLQFHRGLLRERPAMHRILGRIYAVSVLVVLCPTGFYMALYAKGGLPGTTGFLLLGALTFYTTWRGVRSAIAGDIAAHRVWIIRSYAMITTAITFRLFHVAFYFAGVPAETSYLMSLWISLIANGLTAEGLLRRRKTRHTRRKEHHAEEADHLAHVPVR